MNVPAPPPGFVPEAAVAPSPSTPPPGFVPETPTQKMREGQRAMVDGAAERELQRNAAISRALGNQFDPAKSFGGGLKDFALEVDMGRSATPAAVRRKFLDKYPQGEIMRVPHGKDVVLLGRRNPDEPYRNFGVTGHLIGTMFSEQTLLSLPGAALRSPIAGPVAAAAGFMLGEGAQRGIEYLRGYEDDPVEVGTTNAIKGGLVVAATDAATRGILKLFGIGSRYGKQATDVEKATRRQGLEKPGRGQVGGPFLRGMFQQVGRTAGRIEEKITAESRSLLDAFRRNVDAVPLESVADEQLLQVLRAQRIELDSFMKPGSLTREGAGELLQRGLESWRLASREATRRAYAEALALGDDAAFDLAGAQATAAEARTGVMGAGREVTRQEQVFTPELEQTVAQEVTETPGVRVTGNLPGELQGIIDDIMALEPTVTKFSNEAGEFSGFEIVKALRTRLFDLKEASEGQTRRWASKLWSDLTAAMESPLSANPRFLEAHRAAAALHRATEETLETMSVARALGAESPETLARKYFMPGNSTALRAYQKLVPTASWEGFRRGFAYDIMREETPTQGLNRLARFAAEDSEGLRLLITPAEESALSKYLFMRQRFDASPAARVLKQNLTEGERMVSLVSEGSVQDVRDLVKMAGGIDSPLANGMRAGVYKNIMDASTVTSKPGGVPVLSPTTMLTQIEKWRTNGRLEGLFRPADWQRIADFERYGAMLSESADIGGGMMAGTIRQEAVEAGATIMSPAGLKRLANNVVKPFFSNELAAMILAAPRVFERLPRGSPAVAKNLRQGTVAISAMITQAEQQREAITR